MTQEQFSTFTNEDIPQQLYHVMDSDVDEETGASLEELILVRMIASTPKCLSYKPLKWFIEEFL